KRDDGIGASIADLRVAAGSNHDILPSVRLEPVGHWGGVSWRWETRRPEFVARLDVERADVRIKERTGNEHEPAGCDCCAAEAWNSPREPRKRNRQDLAGVAEWDRPKDLSAGEIDGGERAPGWRAAGQPERRAKEDPAHGVGGSELRGDLEIDSPRATRRNLRGHLTSRDEVDFGRHVVDVRYEDLPNRIERRAAPVHTTCIPRDDEGALDRRRRVDSFVAQRLHRLAASAAVPEREAEDLS